MKSHEELAQLAEHQMTLVARQEAHKMRTELDSRQVLAVIKATARQLADMQWTIEQLQQQIRDIGSRGDA